MYFFCEQKEEKTHMKFRHIDLTAVKLSWRINALVSHLFFSLFLRVGHKLKMIYSIRSSFRIFTILYFFSIICLTLALEVWINS